MVSWCKQRVPSCGWHTGDLTTENQREEENGPWMEGKQVSLGRGGFSEELRQVGKGKG